jgi:hypothetical protein
MWYVTMFKEEKNFSFSVKESVHFYSGTSLSLCVFGVGVCVCVCVFSVYVCKPMESIFKQMNFE